MVWWLWLLIALCVVISCWRYMFREFVAAQIGSTRNVSGSDVAFAVAFATLSFYLAPIFWSFQAIKRIGGYPSAARVAQALGGKSTTLGQKRLRDNTRDATKNSLKLFSESNRYQ